MTKFTFIRLMCALAAIFISCQSYASAGGTGEHLLRLCEGWEKFQNASVRDSLSQEKYQAENAQMMAGAIACPVFIDGFVGGVVFAQGLLTQRGKETICFPDNYEAQNEIPLILDYLRKNRGQLKLPSAIVMGIALSSNHPCPLPSNAPKKGAKQSFERYLQIEQVKKVDAQSFDRLWPLSTDVDELRSVVGPFVSTDVLLTAYVRNLFDYDIIEMSFVLDVTNARTNKLVRSYVAIPVSTNRNPTGPLLRKNEAKSLLVAGETQVMAKVKNGVPTIESSDKSDLNLERHRAIKTNNGEDFVFELYPVRFLLGDGRIVKCDKLQCVVP